MIKKKQITEICICCTLVYKLGNVSSTSAAPHQCVISISWTAQRLHPVCIVLLILDHPTDVDQLK